MSSTSATVPDSKAVEYYTPEPPIPAGTAFDPQPDGKPIPKVFQKLKLKGLTLQNRIWVSPMCTYSANSKFEATPFHLIHYGQLLLRGPGLTIVEATVISHEGGGSPQDLAIWNDEQARKLKEIVDFGHAQKQLVAIQLGHSGRKASGLPLYLHLEQIADESIGGWPEDVVAPSAIQHRPNGNYLVPKELTNKEINELVKKYGQSARRAVEISGFDAIEIHGAHGYLINEFLSATSNKRTDEYGGSFENRIRFLLDIIEEIKSQVSESVPIFLRISASDNVEEDEDSWKLEDSIKLAKIVVEKGIDMLDVSSGGVNYKQSSRGKKAFHVDLARGIKKAIGDSALVACVGGLAFDVKETTEFVENGDFDVALIGREFLRNPGLVWTWADELGVRITHALQYGWGFYPNKEQIIELIERSSKI